MIRYIDGRGRGRWAKNVPRGIIPRKVKKQLMSGCVIPDSPKNESVAMTMKTWTGISQ